MEVVEDVAAPGVNAGVDQTLSCDMPVITLSGTASGGNGTAGYSFAWTPEGPLTGADTQTPTTETPGVYTLTVTDRSAAYAGDGFDVTFSLDDPAATIAGRADPGVEVDLTYAVILDLLQRWVLDERSVNWVKAACHHDR